nr:hypothetical protein [Lachnospiraceae bacterium]
MRESDINTNINIDTNPDINTNNNIDIDTNSEINTNTNINTNLNTNFNININPDSILNRNQNINPDSILNRNQNINPDSILNRNQNINPDSILNQNQNHKLLNSNDIPDIKGKGLVGSYEEQAAKIEEIYNSLDTAEEKLEFLINTQKYLVMRSTYETGNTGIGSIPAVLENKMNALRGKFSNEYIVDKSEKDLIKLIDKYYEMQAVNNANTFADYKKYLNELPKDDPNREKKALFLARANPDNGATSVSIKAFKMMLFMEYNESQVVYEDLHDELNINSKTKMSKVAKIIGLKREEDIQKFYELYRTNPNARAVDAFRNYYVEMQMEKYRKRLKEEAASRQIKDKTDDKNENGQIKDKTDDKNASGQIKDKTDNRNVREQNKDKTDDKNVREHYEQELDDENAKDYVVKKIVEEKLKLQNVLADDNHLKNLEYTGTEKKEYRKVAIELASELSISGIEDWVQGTGLEMANRKRKSDLVRFIKEYDKKYVGELAYKNEQKILKTNSENRIQRPEESHGWVLKDYVNKAGRIVTVEQKNKQKIEEFQFDINGDVSRDAQAERFIQTLPLMEEDNYREIVKVDDTTRNSSILGMFHFWMLGTHNNVDVNNIKNFANNKMFINEFAEFCRNNPTGEAPDKATYEKSVKAW